MTLHLEEHVLAQIMDEETSAADRLTIEQHLRDCPDCREAYATIRNASRSLGAALRKSDVEVPPLRLPTVQRAWWRGRVAVAAGLAALLIALSVAPTRAWIVQSLLEVRDRVSQLKDRVLGDAPSEPVVVESDPEETIPNEVRVSIPITDNVLDVLVDSRQLSGRLVLNVIAGQSAYAAIMNGGSEELVVAGGLEIRNLASSTSSYSVNVPVAITTLSVRVGNEAVRRFPVNSVGQSWVLELARQ